VAVLYLVSKEEATGKTALAAGIIRGLAVEDKKAGFLRLGGVETGTGDAATIKNSFGFADEYSLALESAATADVIKAVERLKENCSSVLIEGAFQENSGEIAKGCGARVIGVEDYADPLPDVSAYAALGDSLMGVILNKVPEMLLEATEATAAERFSKVGVTLLGVIPEKRVLSALTVGEIAESVCGNIVNQADKSGSLVQNYILGVLMVDPGPDYFGRLDNKAVLMRHSRSDMQLAALETSVKCLVLTGSNDKPNHMVLQKADRHGVPLIVTSTDTETALMKIEKSMGLVRFRHKKNVALMASIMPKLDL